MSHSPSHIQLHQGILCKASCASSPIHSWFAIPWPVPMPPPHDLWHPVPSNRPAPLLPLDGVGVALPVADPVAAAVALAPLAAPALVQAAPGVPAAGAAAGPPACAGVGVGAGSAQSPTGCAAGPSSLLPFLPVWPQAKYVGLTVTHASGRWLSANMRPWSRSPGNPRHQVLGCGIVSGDLAVSPCVPSCSISGPLGKPPLVNRHIRRSLGFRV
jgi:hypothetical protein